VYAAILEHPFLRGLADGSLERERFRFYVVQDAHFLREYARALSALAARAPGEREIVMFNRHAAEVLQAERSLHESFFEELGLTEEFVARTPMAPSALAYTSFVRASAHGDSFLEGLCAVLPCYWIYWEVGSELARRGSPDPLYARWIEAYSGEEFEAVVRDVIRLTDGLGADVGAVERRRAAERFVTAARYEWMFWEMGWSCERWPPG